MLGNILNAHRKRSRKYTLKYVLSRLFSRAIVPSSYYTWIKIEK